MSILHKLLTPLFGFIHQKPANDGPTLTATLSPPDAVPVFEVDRRYLSFSIDISVLVGGFWWEGSLKSRRGLGTLRVPALDLTSNKLDQLVSALGPSYLRVGGSEADKIHYFDSETKSNDQLILTRETWDALHAFIQRNQLKFAFTFKYGLFKRRMQGEWSGTELQKLLLYSISQKYTIDICELGNELNAYWAFHGLKSQPRAHNLARDYTTFTQLVRRYYPDIRICGPGSAFWPRLGETIRPFSNITAKFLETLQTQLDIVDWHYYPFQSERSPVRTRSATQKNALTISHYDTFSRFSQQLRLLRDRYQPQAQLWTGETGSAQCGGQPRISDRFISSFWWADQLGQGGLNEQKVMVRQSLIGGDYGMIDRLTLKPRPDYWISWFWVQLMGEAVYRMSHPSADIRAYCHSDRSGEGLCVLLVNPSSFDYQLNISEFGKMRQRFAITAKKLTARKIRVNGVKPKFKKGTVSLGDFPDLTNEPHIPPFSINFWRFDP